MGKELAKFDPKWGAMAQEYADQERGGGLAAVSTRGGVLKVGDQEMPGNRMCVLILDAVRENTYYGRKFDPEHSLPPICYALGRDEREMRPHTAMKEHSFFEAQSSDCASCPMAEWGSSPTGRGKACSNRRRLLLLPAGDYVKVKGSRGEYDLELYDDERHFEDADMAVLKLPVTSVKNFTKYVSLVAKRYGRPPAGVFTEIFVEPDPNSQYKIHFDLIDEVPDELAEVVLARHEEARDAILEPYRPPQDEVDEDRSRRRVSRRD